MKIEEITFAEEETKTCMTKEDFEVALASPNFSYKSSHPKDLSDFKFGDDLSISLGTKDLFPTKRFFKNFCNIIGIPDPFARSIPGDLLKSNIDRLSRDKNYPVRVISRKSDGAAVNIIPADLTPVPSTALLEKLNFNFLNGENAIAPGYISTEGITVKMEIPTVNLIEPDKGDIIKTSYLISNSDIGSFMSNASASLLRLVCTNGATLSKQWGAVRWPGSNRLSFEEQMKIFVNKVNGMRTQVDELHNIFDVMKESIVNEEQYVNLMNNLQRRLTSRRHGTYLGSDPKSPESKKIFREMVEVPGYNNEEIFERVQSKWRDIKRDPFSTHEEPMEIEGLSFYNLYNHVTALPHRFMDDISRVRTTEWIGGGIIDYVKDNLYRK